MSMEVDKRIVEMQFKNDQFEKGAKESIDTLGKLKKSLDLEGSSKGLKQLGDSVKNISLESLAASVDQISSRFSTLGIIGMTALQNITNSAINAGKQLIASLTIEPIQQGFGEYELKMGSVQTIMASTGESLENVNGYLEELNKYADKTIYSFSDMTANIGKFTNAGVKLGPAVKAIQGISNEAAVSGANTNEASRAMYNFAQALSAGYVKLIDWKSIENANMATVEFKNELIKTAVEMGTLTEASDGMYTTLSGNTLNATRDFNDSLKDQWMTTDVLVETLGRYADETTDIGKKAFAAAQDVKTFSQLMDTLKEAAGSGWAQTFEIIIGDFNEAKSLFTAMSKEFGGIIDSMSKARNDLLEGAFGFSSSIAKEGWRTVFQDIERSGKEFIDSDLWSSMQKNIGMNKAYRQAVLEMAVAAGTLKKTEDGLYDTGKHLISATSSNVEWAASLADGWFKASIATDALKKSFDETDKSMVRMSGRELLFDSLKNIWEGLKTIAGSVKAAFENIFPAFTSENLYKIIEGFNNLTKALKPSPIVADRLRRTFQGLFAVLHIIVQPLKFIAQAFVELIKFIFPAGDGFLSVTASIGDFLTSVDQAITKSGVFAKALDGFKTGLQAVKDAIKAAIDYVRDVIAVISDWVSGNGELSDSLDKAKNKTEGFSKSVEILAGIGKVFQTIGSGIAWFFGKIWEGIKWIYNLPFVQKTIESFGNAFKSVGKNMSNAMGPVAEAWNAFIERIKNMDGITPENVFGAIQDFFGNVVGKFLTGLWNSLTPLGGAFVKFFEDLFDKIATVLGKNDKLKPLADIAEKIKNFFASLSGTKDGSKGISNLNKAAEGLGKVTDVFSGISDAMGPVFSKIGDFLSKNFPAIMTMLTGIGILKGIHTLSTMGKALVQGVQALTKGVEALGGVLSGVSKVVTNFGKLLKGVTFKTYTEAIFDLVKSIGVLVAAVIILTFIDPNKLMEATKVLGILVGMLAGLIVVVTMISNKFTVSPKQILSMSAVLMSFAGAIVVLAFAMLLMGLAKDPMQSMKVIAGIMISFIAVVLTLGHAFKDNDKAIRNAATAIAAFGASILMIAFALKLLEGLKNVVQDLVVFAGMLIGMVIVTKALGKNQNATMAAAAGLMAFAGAMLLLTVAFGFMEKLQNPLKSMLIFGSMIFGLVLFVTAVGKMKNEAKVSAAVLLSFAGAILIIAAAMALIGFMKPESIILALVSISIIMSLLIGVIAVSAIAGKEAHKAGALLAGLGVSLLMIAFAMTILGSISQSSMKKALGTILILGMVFVGVIAISKLAGQHAMKAGILLLAMSAALLILSGVIWILGSLDPEVAARGTTAVIALMAVMSLLIAVGKKAKTSYKYIIAITACMVALGIMVAALSMIEPGRLAVATAALDSLMVCFGVLLKLSKGSQKVSASIFILLGVVAALGLLVGALSEYFITDGSKFLQVATGVSLLMVAMGVFGQLISSPALQALSPAAAAKVTGALDIALAMVVGVIAGIGAIVNAIDEFTGGGASAAIEKGLQVLIDIANGIGTAIGSFIGGIGEGISNSLPAIADNLSIFGEKLQPFFNVITNLPDGAEAKMGQIVAAIGVLTASDFIYSLTQFFGGKSFEQYGSELSAFGDGLKTFVGSISDLTDDDLDRIKIASEATKLLSEAFANMPTEGGFLSLIFGNSIGGEAFGQQLASFGDALKKFRDSVKDLTEDDVKAINIAARAAKSLTDVANSIPNSGGLLGLLAGNNDIDDFGTRLVSFGNSLTSFAKSVRGFTEDDATKIGLLVPAVQQLIDMGKTMENAGGVLGFLAGNDDIGELGNQLTKFGDGLKSFSKSIADLNRGHMAKWKTLAESITPLIEMGNTLKNDGGFISFFTGDNGLDDLGTQLTGFGEGLVSFGKSLNDLDNDQIDKIKLASEAAKGLVSLGNNLHMENSGGFDWLTGGNGLDTLGNQLGAFGSGMAAFATNLGTFDQSHVNRINNAAVAASGLLSLANASAGLKSFNELSLDSNFESKAGYFASGMTAMSTGLKDFAKVDENIERAATSMLKLGEVGDAKDSVAKFIELSLDGFQAKVISFCNALNTLNASIPSISSDKSTSITNAANVFEALGGVANNSENISSFIAVSFTGFAGKITALGSAMKSIKEKLGDFTESDLGKVTRVNSALTAIGDISNAAQTIGVNTDLSRFESFTTMLTSRLEDFASKCIGIVENRSAIDGVLTLVNSIAYQISNSSSVFNPELVQGMTDKLNDLISLIKSMEMINDETIGGFINALEAIGNGAIQRFVDAFKAGTEDVKTVIDAMFKGAMRIIQTGGTDIIKLTGTVCKGIVTVLDSYPSTIYSSSRALSIALVDGFVNHDKYQMRASAEAAVSGIASAVSSRYQEVYDAGWNLMAGLARGIAAGQSMAVSAAASAMSSAIQTAKSTAGINSPSKVMMEIGGYIDEGLAIGMRKNMSMTNKASEEVTNTVLGNMASSVDKILSLINGDLDMSPVITPVIDTSGISLGLSSINSMFAEQEAMKIAADMDSSGSVSSIQELINLNKAMLSAIKSGGDIYLNENLIIGRINRRLGAL